MTNHDQGSKRLPKVVLAAVAAAITLVLGFAFSKWFPDLSPIPGIVSVGVAAYCIYWGLNHSR